MKENFAYLSNIIKHDGKHTKKSDRVDEIDFVRWCKIRSTTINCHLYVNRQFTINNHSERYSCNNNWDPNSDDPGTIELYKTQDQITFQQFFDFSQTDEIKNVIYFDTHNLQKCRIKVTYSDDSIIEFGYQSEVTEKQEIPLFNFKSIKLIELFDNLIKPEKIEHHSVLNIAYTKCSYKNERVGSHSCMQECPNFVGNKGDYSDNPILCNYKTNKKQMEKLNKKKVIKQL